MFLKRFINSIFTEIRYLNKIYLESSWNSIFEQDLTRRFLKFDIWTRFPRGSWNFRSKKICARGSGKQKIKVACPKGGVVMLIHPDVYLPFCQGLHPATKISEHMGTTGSKKVSGLLSWYNETTFIIGWFPIEDRRTNIYNNGLEPKCFFAHRKRNFLRTGNSINTLQ